MYLHFSHHGLYKGNGDFIMATILNGIWPLEYNRQIKMQINLAVYSHIVLNDKVWQKYLKKYESNTDHV